MKKHNVIFTILCMFVVFTLVVMVGCGTPPPKDAGPKETITQTVTSTPVETPVETITAVPVSPVVTPVETPEATPETPPETPMDTPVESPGVEVETDVVDIDIMPPTDTSPVPEATKTEMPKDTGETPSFPAVESEENSYNLTGVMTIGDSKHAMMKKDGKTINASVGQVLEDGWVVSSIEDRSVVLKKGDKTKTITLREEIGAPPAPPTE
ncbi:MAG: hypothetical protein ACLFQV_04800 [Vulcanimicrobiota bacterium]